jgi:hypothetical protein
MTQFRMSLVEDFHEPSWHLPVQLRFRTIFIRAHAYSKDVDAEFHLGAVSEVGEKITQACRWDAAAKPAPSGVPSAAHPPASKKNPAKNPTGVADYPRTALSEAGSRYLEQAAED